MHIIFTYVVDIHRFGTLWGDRSISYVVSIIYFDSDKVIVFLYKLRQTSKFYVFISVEIYINLNI